MSRLADAPTDLLFGLFALHNELVAPDAIPAALEAQAEQPGRTLADTLEKQGALSAGQRAILESLSSECIARHAGNVRRSIATLAASPSAQERLRHIKTPEITEAITAALSLDSTLAATTAFRPHDADGKEPRTALGVQLPTSQIAGYEIIEVLGVGGMGVVYKARQPRLDRFVALKMIRAGSSARPEDILRFETEAKAVAAIEHTNFVRIFEIGEHEGQPYFSLEYLPGGSLANRIGGKPQPFDEAARIVETLAGAMHVAHEHKVIHRDLKPTNVLFAADGTLKITDFGLVKRLEDDSGQTRSGSILGTPSYMAPEQARGESQHVGPAADQYALGAILYELLTGRPPFQGTSVLETLDMVRNREPVPPSRLQPKTPRDIETICLKCLEKEPGRRYPDTRALAEDLRRFRAGETIVARPVSEVERLSRWCLRNRVLAGLMGTVGFLVPASVIGLAVGFLILSQKNEALSTARTVAEEKRVLAEVKEQKAIKAAHAANSQNLALVDSQVELIILLERKLRFVPAIQGEREQILDKASARLEGAARAMTDLRRDVDWAPQDEVRNWKALARAHQAQGSLSLSRRQITEGVAQFRQVEEIIGRLAKADPADLDMQVNLLRVERQLGYALMEQVGDSEGAQKYLRRAIEISKGCLAKKPESDTYKSELANSIGGLARSEATLGHLDAARELYREEIGVRESFSKIQAGDWESRRELAGYLADRAALFVRMGEVAEARSLYDKVAAMRVKLADERPDSWPAQNDLGLTYNQQGTMRYPNGNEPKKAREFHGKAIAIFRKRALVDAADLLNKTTLALTLYYDAGSALAAGDQAGAADEFRECLAIRKELANEPDAKMPQSDLMLALARCGDFAEASRIAGTLVATPPKDENIYILSACGYALSAGAAAGGGKSDLAREYRNAAIDCVRKATERGWRDVVTLKTDTDLEPIRKDRDFQAIIAELERSGKPR